MTGTSVTDEAASAHDLQADPGVVFPELFARLAELAAPVDFKAIADAAPRAALADIRAHFLSRPPACAEEVRDFVQYWFPDAAVRLATLEPALAAAPLRTHISALWPRLTRSAQASAPHSSLIALPHRYLVPGGMFREMYYWDCYFTLVGLAGESEALKRECVDNLAHLIDGFGFVPNGNRTYYLSRSQPPMFFAMVALLDPASPQRAFARYLPQLVREHAYWLHGEDRLNLPGADLSVVRMPDGAVLNRYWDERDSPRTEAFGRDLAFAAASLRKPQDLFREIRSACATGWDFSSRWFSDSASIATIETTAIIPIDLNCLLYGLELAIEAGARYSGQTNLESDFCARAQARRDAIAAYLWNEQTGAFDDFDWRRGCLRNAITPASFFPLFVEMATPEQAERTAELMRRSLLCPGGLVTSLHNSGEQWDAPNGWAPLQWIAVDGLRKYGLDAFAKEIAERWVALVGQVFADSGRLFEKYDVINLTAGGGGEYPVQDGFGWTNGVTAALLEHYPELADLAQAQSRSA